MVRLVRAVLLGAALILTGGIASAAEGPAPADAALEKRVLKLSEELRCLVCQNQTIADSNADLAVDLKNQVREQLRQGKSEDDIIKYMVARYGDFVLYRPPVKGITALLWFGPLLLVVAGLAGLMLYLRKRRSMATEDDPADAVLDDYDLAAPDQASPPPRT
jgi:cytochrome c-type biogenesis protein CcmH